MITLEDWRNVSPDVLAPLYEAECARWDSSLGWDYRASCGLIEAARTGGRLPGLLARDRHGAVAGWSYFLLHQDTLQIGNVVSSDAEAVLALVAAIVGRPEAKRARRMSCFLFPDCQTVEQALVRARFSPLRHAYMRRALDTCPGLQSETHATPAPSDLQIGTSCEYRLRPWSPDDLADLLVLLQSAYERTNEVRCFAPDGDIGQWATYVHQLTQTPACGRFERGLSFAVETRGGEMAGAILVTALSRDVAHIAQMAVGADHRRQGIGEWMVQAACDRARQERYQAVTLLVAESNERARRLYDRVGFARVTDFLFADRTAPR